MDPVPPPLPPPPPPDNDPYRAVWQMSQVGAPTGRSHWWSDLKLGAGIVGGLLVMFPFGLIASAIWGWWGGEQNWGAGGWVTVLIGLTAALCVGGFVASES